MTFAELRKKLLSKAIVAAVPLLNKVRNPPHWPHPLPRLRMLPPGSLGRELADFLDARGMSLLNKYERHDTLHVLLGYDTDVEGELRLQGFMLGNGTATRPGLVLFALGMATLPTLWRQLACEVARGALTPAVDITKLSTRVAKPLDRVRAEMSVGEPHEWLARV